MSTQVELSSQASQQQHASTACSLCSKAGQYVIGCLSCNEAVHPACLLKLFKDAGHEALKNKVDWFTEFIKFSPLIYRCKECQEKSVTVPIEHCEPVVELSNRINAEMSTVKQSIAALDVKLSSILSSVNQHSCDLSLGVPVVNKTSDKACLDKSGGTNKSYAAAVGTNLPEIVKTVLAESVKEQRRSERDNASLVIYNLKESSNDIKKVRELFCYCDCADTVVQVVRLGKPSQPSVSKPASSPRPLKVELWSQRERDFILQQAHFLCDSSRLRISKYLNSAEMTVLKETRSECAKLNSTATKLANGRARFVVINDRIMKRLDDGKLVRFTRDLSSAAVPTAVSDPQSSPSKNGSGRSQGAPPSS